MMSEPQSVLYDVRLTIADLIGTLLWHIDGYIVIVILFYSTGHRGCSCIVAIPIVAKSKILQKPQEEFWLCNRMVIMI